MINKKRGFTLAELLITLTIAALVTAMGVTITKRKVQKAYDEYFYTGYNTVARLLREAEYKEETKADGDEKHYTTTNFLSDIVKPYLTLDTEPTGGFEKNGILYKIEETTTDYMKITMVVPRAKTKEYQDGKARAELRYYFGKWPYPIPVLPESGEEGTPINLAKRIDLLPCYINQNLRSVCANEEDADGNPEIKKCDDNNEFKYTHPKYMSVQQAFCSTIDDKIEENEDIRDVLDCGGVNYQDKLAGYNIKFVPPRQAHR